MAARCIIFTRTAGATAFYNAMQVEANRRFSNGLTSNSTYTWAKSLADNLGPNSTGFVGETGGGRAADLYNRQGEYGDDYAVRRHRSISIVVYDLPFGKGRKFANGIHPMGNAVIGGWQLSAIFLAQTGPFLTPFLGSNVVDPSGERRGSNRNFAFSVSTLRNRLWRSIESGAARLRRKLGRHFLPTMQSRLPPSTSLPFRH